MFEVSAMLYNPDDKNKGKKEEKLLHADDDNKNLTDDVKANENSLFGKPSGNSADHGHDSLFDSSFDDDDFVGSSFAVSFKANDPGNVSDMLKDDNTTPIQPAAPLEYEDDLADFEFDSSVSAFKPLNQTNAPTHIPAPEHTPGSKANKPEEAKPVEVKKVYDLPWFLRGLVTVIDAVFFRLNPIIWIFKYFALGYNPITFDRLINPF